MDCEDNDIPIPSVEELSVDIFQDMIDKYFLTIFEIMRATPSDDSASVNATELIQKYHNLYHGLDLLIGMNKSSEELDADFESVNKRITQHQSEIIEYELKLHELSVKVDCGLEKILGIREM